MRKDINLENAPQKGHCSITAVEEGFFLIADSLKIILNSLEDAKAGDIVSINIQDRSSFADYMVLASARSQRHLSAVTGYLLRNWKNSGRGQVRVEGLSGGGWVLIDTGDIIVHLFRPEIRALYDLEKIWLARD